MNHLLNNYCVSIEFPDVSAEFVLSAVDDFATEVEALRQNKEFMEFLAQRSRSTKRLSIADTRKRLGI